MLHLKEEPAPPNFWRKMSDVHVFHASAPLVFAKVKFSWRDLWKFVRLPIFAYLIVTALFAVVMTLFPAIGQAEDGPLRFLSIVLSIPMILCIFRVFDQIKAYVSDLDKKRASVRNSNPQVAELAKTVEQGMFGKYTQLSNSRYNPPPKEPFEYLNEDFILGAWDAYNGQPTHMDGFYSNGSDRDIAVKFTFLDETTLAVSVQEKEPHSQEITVP